MAKQQLKAPSLEYLLDLQDELTKLYGSQDAQIERIRRVRELTQAVELPDKYKVVQVEVRDPTATDECQRVAASLSVNPPTLTVTPARPTDKAQENATLREHFTEEVLRQAGTRVPGTDTFVQVVDAAVGDGGAWCKLLFVKDLWDERYRLSVKSFASDGIDEDEARRRYDEATEEAKRAAGPPFAWLHVDTRSVYPVWTAGRLTEVLEVQERPALATLRQYRLGRDADENIVPEELAQAVSPSDARPGNTVQFLEHWDSVYVTYAVVGKSRVGTSTGQVVRQWKHGYGRVPYFYAPGLMMNWWRNRKVGWSIAEAKRWLVEYRSYLWTLHAQIAARDAFPPLFRRRPVDAAQIFGDDGRPLESSRWDLREIIEGRPGEELMPMQFPPVAQALKEQIAIVSDAIERLESPRVRAELGSGLEGAGFAINQVLAEARIRHDPIVQSIERMLEDLTRFLWDLIIRKVGETVWVYTDRAKGGWVGMGPEDLAEPVRIRWTLNPERASAKIIEARYWHERMTYGTASNDQAVEAMGDNPDEVRLGRAMDRIRNSELYQKTQEEYLLQEIGRGDLMAKAAYVARTGQLPGQPVTPAMGNELVPDMANLAMAPGGAGATPVKRNLPVEGVGPGAVVPQQAAAAGIQELRP